MDRNSARAVGQQKATARLPAADFAVATSTCRFRQMPLWHIDRVLLAGQEQELIPHDIASVQNSPNDAAL